MSFKFKRPSLRLCAKLNAPLKFAKPFYVNGNRVHSVKAGLFGMRVAAKVFEAKSIGSADNRSIVGVPQSAQILFAKKIAIRRGIWFKALNRLERGIMDLTARYVDKIKSKHLAKIICAIIEKLNFAAESIIERTMRTVGFSLAQKTSLLAQSWGYSSAFNWSSDACFARYLAVMSIKGGRHLS